MQIAAALRKHFPKDVKVFTVKMKHSDAIIAYVTKIEEAHKGAAKSKLKFD